MGFRRPYVRVHGSSKVCFDFITPLILTGKRSLTSELNHVHVYIKVTTWQNIIQSNTFTVNKHRGQLDNTRTIYCEILLRHLGRGS